MRGGLREAKRGRLDSLDSAIRRSKSSQVKSHEELLLLLNSHYMYSTTGTGNSYLRSTMVLNS